MKSISLFIEHCCFITKFERDRILVSTFHNYYQQFCTVNHLDPAPYSEQDLKKDYGIESQFLTETWIVRDPKFNSGSVYFEIDQVFTNHYINALMNLTRDIPLETLNVLNKELILYNGWQVYDLISVCVHLIIFLIIGCPLLVISLLERVNYAEYSL